MYNADVTLSFHRWSTSNTAKVTRQQVTAELRHLLAELRGEPIFLGGYEQERRLLDLTLGFLKTASSRRSACENGLLSILETQAGGGSSIYHALIPRLLLTFAPDGLEIHKEIALHHSFLPAGLTHALPRAVADLERLLRLGNGVESRPPEGSSDSSDEETGHHPRGSTFQLDLMRVALDGAFSWVQLMLMLTYHDEFVEALAMKILRERNSELMNQSDSNLDPSDPMDDHQQHQPQLADPADPSDSARDFADFYASPREASDSGRASLVSAEDEGSEPGEGSRKGEGSGEGEGSEGSEEDDGKKAHGPIKEEQHFGKRSVPKDCFLWFTDSILMHFAYFYLLYTSCYLLKVY